jgi:hypothetical protein
VPDVLPVNRTIISGKNFTDCSDLARHFSAILRLTPLSIYLTGRIDLNHDWISLRYRYWFLIDLRY